jgi:hypothetical protein
MTVVASIAPIELRAQLRHLASAVGAREHSILGVMHGLDLEYVCPEVQVIRLDSDISHMMDPHFHSPAILCHVLDSPPLTAVSASRPPLGPGWPSAFSIPSAGGQVRFLHNNPVNYIASFTYEQPGFLHSQECPCYLTPGSRPLWSHPHRGQQFPQLKSLSVRKK